MKHLLSLLFLLFTLCLTSAWGQTVIEIKPDVHPSLDSLIKKSVVTDATKARAMAVVDKTAGHAAYNLRDDYDLTPLDGKRQLRDFTTLDQAKVNYADTWRSLVEERAPSGQPRFSTVQAEQRLLNMSPYDAAFNDAIWKNSPYIPLAGSAGLLLSNNKITIPLGGWWATTTSRIAYGITEGEGSFNANDQSGLGGTEVHLWHEKWQDDKVNMVLMTAFHGGSDNFYAYSEGQQVHNLRLNGHADTLKRAGRTITGFRAWDAGSGSNYSNMFIHHCDEGLDVVRGTPFTGSGSFGLFSNTVCGLCVTGGSGGSQGFETVELDDNGRGIWVRPGWGRPAGCELEIDLTKMEQLVTPARYYAPNTIVLEGWVDATFTAISVAAAWGYLGDLIDLNANVNTSKVEIGSLRVFGNKVYQNVIYDRLNKKHLPFDIGYTSRIKKVEWYSDMGGTVFVKPNTAATMVPTTRGPGRLGYLKAGPDGQPLGSFDLLLTKPSWTDEGGLGGTPGPNPSPCTTWTMGPWSTCVGGQRSRAVTPFPAGCTGTPPSKPVETQSCVTPPVGIPQTITSATSTDPKPCTLPLVKKITYTKLRVPTGTDVSAFAGYLCDKVYIGFGGLYYDNPGQTKAATVTPGVNITNVAGTNTLVLEFNPPVVMKYAVGSDLQTVPFTASKIVLE